MATISENLQIIKNSTDAIKQAIIDKGGTINGDITTWANAINGISSEGSTEPEYIFTGTAIMSGRNLNINGTLNKVPDLIGMRRLAATVLNEVGQVVVGFSSISTDTNVVYNISIYDAAESGNAPENIPMFILTQVGPTQTMTAVKFVQKNRE